MQPRYAKPPSDFGHFGLRERFALFNSLLDGAQDNFFEKFDIVWVDNFFVDLDGENVTCAVCCHFHFAASRTYFDRLVLQFGLSFGQSFFDEFKRTRGVDVATLESMRK